MNKEIIEALFSKERVNKYFLRFPENEQKAIELMLIIKREIWMDELF
jgi:hypothetical protein